MDLQLKMMTFKTKNRLKYLRPEHLKTLFPDIYIRGIARKIWRCDSSLCNPKRKQFKR